MKGDFAYGDDNGRADPAIRGGEDYFPRWESASRYYSDDEVTPVQVVGPGQVAVDAADLRSLIDNGSFRYPVTDVPLGNLRDALAAADDLDAKPSADDQTSDRLAKSAPEEPCDGSEACDCDVCRREFGLGSKASVQEVRDVLRKQREAEPAPDTEQGETWGERRERLREALVFAECEHCTPATDAEAGGDQGETCNGGDSLHPFEPGRTTDDPPGHKGDPTWCHVCGEPRSPAAEPQRVTLPDTAVVPPEPPVGTWMRDRFGGVTLHQSDGWGPPGCHPSGKWAAMWEARGPYVECGEWGMDTEPPKPDPAETDDTFEQYQRELRHTQAIEDRAAKRGCDEALAVVVKALSTEADQLRLRGLYATSSALSGAAGRIQREQGGDL